MNSDELATWLQSLKAGDEVGVYRFYGRIYERKVKVQRVTKARVYLECGEVYTKGKGAAYGCGRGSVYAEKRIRPLPT